MRITEYPAYSSKLVISDHTLEKRRNLILKSGHNVHDAASPLLQGTSIRAVGENNMKKSETSSVLSLKCIEVSFLSSLLNSMNVIFGCQIRPCRYVKG